MYVIETAHEKDGSALETVRSLFAAKTKDFVTAVDEKNIILVKEVKPGETYEDLEKTANMVLDMLNTEAMSKVHVAFGTVVSEIKEVSRSYKEAKMALDVGKIFYSGKERGGIQQAGHRPPDLSASAPAVPDVHQGDIRRQVPGRVRRGDPSPPSTSSSRTA